MPDSPKCPKCKGQTYRVAGKFKFRCHDCKLQFDGSIFKPSDFEWKDEKK